MTSGLQALTHVGVSLIALGQVIYLLPSRAGTSKLILWTFCLVPLVPYLANAVAVQNQQSSLAYSQPRVHPVEVLIQNAKAEFDSMLARQSRTYAEAHSEYRRRYGIEPPPGFEAWYYFAKANDSPIIDDYDTIYGSVSPLWRLSGREVRDIMNQVQQAPDSELWACIFSGHQATTHCHHPYRAFDRHIQFLFDKLLGDLRGVLPDVKFLVNHFDEPRVVIPGQSSPGSTSNPQFNITDLSRRPVWDILTKACTRTGEKNQDNQKKQAVETFGLPFVADRPAAMDLCRQPEYSEMHGLMMSPSVFRLIEGTVPVLSTGAPSTMGDILYPSPAYFEPEFQYTDTQDVDWDRKRNNLYWAGSTTGGVASSSGSYTNSVSDSWHFYHRQRFVSLAQNLQRRQHSYLHETSGIIHRVKTTFLNTHLFDVAFTRIFQCGWRQCRQQRAYFKTKSWANKDQAFRSRLVFDIDGNGISGRYYKLLASRSAPLKQTLLREWHDDRLVPWVHYIPVSQGMEELPELVTYLTSTESGRENAREIAEQGRDWFAKAFRDVDLSVYVYRLVLELARLQDPRREGRWELV